MASTPAVSGDQLTPLNMGEMAGTPRQPLVELVSGVTDVEPWSDDQEVTCDRIVGDIGVQCAQDYAGVTVSLPQELAPPVCRFGILVVEEGSDPSLDLFDDATLQKLEWMWLKQVTAPINYYVGSGGGGTGNLVTAVWDFSLDLRNRRKIGFADKLCLYGGYAYQGAASNQLRSQTFVECSHTLRTILMGR